MAGDDDDAQLVTLHRQRGALKAKVTAFSNFLNTIKQKEPKDLTVAEIRQLETRIERIVPILDRLEQLQNKIYLFPDVQEVTEMEYVSQFEDTYFTVVSEAKALLELATFDDTQPEIHTSTSGVGLRSNASSVASFANLQGVKLPTINLPKFNGQYVKWLEFHDTFASLIHDNESLSDVQKFHYLRASLESDASDIIKSLQISAANYDIAWKLLCDRYTNKKLLIQNHLSELFNLKDIKTESAAQLRELSDTVTKHLRSLDALQQPTDQWDRIIIYLVTSKLDRQTARDWESYKIVGELPSLEELKTFLSFRADMLDNLNRFRVDTFKPQKPKVVKSYTSSNCSCYLCKGAHAIYNCDQFLALPIKERLDKVNSLKLCSNCLRNNHLSKDCNTRFQGCRKCKQKHNTLLHIDKPDQSTVDHQASLSAQLASTSCHILLATALVQIKDNQGHWHSCRVLLDSGSQSNFITIEFFRRLGISKSNVNISVQGINQVVSPINSQCVVSLKSNVNNFSTQLKCLIIDKISENLPSVTIDTINLKLPDNLQLADPSYDIPGKIDLLIGAQLFWSLLTEGQVRLGKGLPVLQNSYFGWILSGPFQTRFTSSSTCYFSKTFDVQQQLQKFWELEECPNVKCLSDEEQQCEDYFIDTIQKDETGRFIVSIPLKDSPGRLGESRSTAMKRFQHLEKRFHFNPILKESYTNFMTEYLNLGHMSRIEAPDDSIPHFYIPHHGVINENSLTTRLRVVFDGSCPSSSGISVNDLQLVGPTVQSDLFTILIRFRQHLVAFSADVQKMYRQILVRPDERRFQRILWREDPSLPVTSFELNTVTYGTAAAPYLATRCLIQVANEYSTKFPEASNIIKSDFYVDDVLSGGNSIEDVKILCAQISSILQQVHFPLHKWVSNDPEVRSQFSISTSDSSPIYLGSGEMSKTLGLYWLPSIDSLTYKISDSRISENVSKRQILSTVSQIFDPLGLLSPCIIIGKSIMQLLWQEKLGWDDIIPKSISDKWIKIQRDLSVLNNLQIPRHILCQNPVLVQLHGFSDASEIAYAACIYAKAVDCNGDSHVNLVCAKSKVAPLKRLTIPRLELCGAHLLSKLISVVKNSLRLDISHTYLWCDSTIVLGWLKTCPSLLKVFVSHRVSEIQSNSKNATWLHVPTADNPADLASRGVYPKQLTDSHLWWHGPVWLSSDDSHWPHQTLQDSVTSLPEIKRVEISLVSSSLQFPIEINKFSSFNKLIRSTAFCLRFIHNIQIHDSKDESENESKVETKKKSNRLIGSLSVDELNHALVLIIKSVQYEFSNDIRCLQSDTLLPSKSKILGLNPFLDTEGILRVGGRLQSAEVSFDKKHQILLPKHHFTRLLFSHEHKRLLHAGPQLLLSVIRDKYWPLDGRNLARFTVHKCVICFRNKPVNVSPQMGNFPKDRVKQAFPFQVSGVDYAGPLTIKDRMGRGCKTSKCYVAVFVCFSTKAIHLELVSNLSTEAFLASLKRFIARRGKPTKLFSDNGSNFIGADRELKQLVERLKSDENLILAELAQEGISWSFIPPSSPHFGGLWEAGVKSFKFHLKRVASNVHLTFEQLLTLLTQIESVLNCRPLTPMSTDPNDLEPLTPSHFLIGRKLTNIPEENLLDLPQNRLSNFQLVQQLYQHFWSRWNNEYLHTLQQRKKWQRPSPNVKVGTMVLLKTDDTPSVSWPVGRIVEVFPGKDDTVRVVKVQTARGIYKRSITKVYPLPMDEEGHC